MEQTLKRKGDQKCRKIVVGYFRYDLYWICWDRMILIPIKNSDPCSFTTVKLQCRKYSFYVPYFITVYLNTNTSSTNTTHNTHQNAYDTDAILITCSKKKYITNPQMNDA